VFAFNQSVNDAPLRVGSDQSLKRVMGQVQMQNFLNEVQSMESLLQPLVKPMQALQHDPPLWQEQQRRHAPPPADCPWLPNDDELGLPTVQTTTSPPNPLHPPRFPSYPDPSELEAQDDAEFASRARQRKQAHEEELEKQKQRNTKSKAHARPSGDDANYNSRMGVYATPEEAPAMRSLLADGSDTHDLGAFKTELERRSGRLATEEGRKKLLSGTARTRKARHSRPVVSRIPWTLLDELEAEKYKLKQEKGVAMIRDNTRGKSKKSSPHK